MDDESRERRAIELFERIVGSIAMLVGLAVLVVGLFVGRGIWLRVSRWPQTAGIVVAGIHGQGVIYFRLRYEAGGRSFTGTILRFGNARQLRRPLEQLAAGSAHRVSWNPANPADMDVDLGYDWDTFWLPAVLFLLACAIMGAGALISRHQLHRLLLRSGGCNYEMPWAEQSKPSPQATNGSDPRKKWPRRRRR